MDARAGPKEIVARNVCPPHRASFLTQEVEWRAPPSMAFAVSADNKTFRVTARALSDYGGAASVGCAARNAAGVVASAEARLVFGEWRNCAHNFHTPLLTLSTHFRRQIIIFPR